MSRGPYKGYHLIARLPAAPDGSERWSARSSEGDSAEVILGGAALRAWSERLPSGGPWVEVSSGEDGELFWVLIPDPHARNFLQLRPAPAPVAVAAVRELLIALDGLHREGRFHGQLHPAGVGFDRSGRLRVRPLYHEAPLPDPDGKPPDAATDCWQAGCLLLYLLGGSWPPGWSDIDGIDPHGLHLERIKLLISGLMRDQRRWRLAPARRAYQAASAVIRDIQDPDELLTRAARGELERFALPTSRGGAAADPSGGVRLSLYEPREDKPAPARETPATARLPADAPRAPSAAPRAPSAAPRAPSAAPRAAEEPPPTAGSDAPALAVTALPAAAPAPEEAAPVLPAATPAPEEAAPPPEDGEELPTPGQDEAPGEALLDAAALFEEAEELGALASLEAEEEDLPTDEQPAPLGASAAEATGAPSLGADAPSLRIHATAIPKEIAEKLAATRSMLRVDASIIPPAIAEALLSSEPALQADLDQQAEDGAIPTREEMPEPDAEPSRRVPPADPGAARLAVYSEAASSAARPAAHSEAASSAARPAAHSEATSSAARPAAHSDPEPGAASLSVRGAPEPGAAPSAPAAGPLAQPPRPLDDDADELASESILDRNVAAMGPAIEQDAWGGPGPRITGDAEREAELGAGKWTEEGRPLEELTRELPSTPTRDIELEEPRSWGPIVAVVLLSLVAAAVAFAL